MSKMRTTEMIRHDLATALAYRASHEHRPVHDVLAQEMRDSNEREITELQAELEEALSGELEVSLDGRHVEGHRVSLGYFNRLTESVQAAFRAAFRTLTTDGKVRRNEASLSIAATSPGSFRVSLKVPPTQLDLMDDPLIDRAMNAIVDLLESSANGTIATVGREWAARASEGEVRSMIRLAVSMASSQGTTKVRWRGVDRERIVEVAAPAARDLAIALAGQSEREIVVVHGQLEMAGSDPPRVRIRTEHHDYLAKVLTSDLLDLVKTLLFDDVQATLAIDMRTSATSGRPDTTTELLDIEPAPD
jgi:hypothetical protein